jgi:hypothetical protein
MEFGEKPMVYYTDETPVVNKRLVAGYYLFLCLVGFAILLGPTGSGIPVTLISDRVREAHELATPNFGNGCLTGDCHSTEWDYWNMTTHSGYLVELNESTQIITVNGHRATPYAVFNATCAQCHAINWNNASYPNTHDGFGTNCFSCHSNTSPYYSVDGEICDTCHVGHSGTFVENWQNSAHANSLTDLRASSHAGSSCMHCLSTEGFLGFNGFFGTDTDLDPQGDYNSLTCPACHAVHSAQIVNPAMIYAVNSTELCGLCHVGDRQPMYTVWSSGPHSLTGIVECTSCHGFQQGSHGAEMNHTFLVIPEDACGQAPECHEGQETWAINQLEEIQSSYDALVADIEAETAAFEAVVNAYNATAGANHTLVSHVLGIVDDAMSTVSYYNNDRSSGFHNPTETFDALNSAYRDVLNAKAYYYANVPAPAAGFSADTLIIVGGAAGGIVVGLLLGVLVGRRR